MIATAAGHPAAMHLEAVATRVAAGKTETATLALAETQRLDRVCNDGLCSGTWFDGFRRFDFGINGALLPEADSRSGQEQTFAAIASTRFAESEFLSAGGTVSVLPGTDGTTSRYRVIAPHGAELIAVADTLTHRLQAIELPDGRLFRQLTASAIGTTIVYGGRGYDRMVVPPAPLVPPAGPAVSVKGHEEIPLLSDVLPIVPCTLSGHRARCLIDTGTTPSAVTLSFSETLGQEPHGTIEIAGLATYLTGVVEAGPLKLGGATIEPLQFAVIPHARQLDFDVILGSDALTHLSIAFDIERRQVRIGASGPMQSGGRIPMEFAHGLPYISVRLGGRDRNEPMLLDTGDSETLSIGYDEYRSDPGLFALSGAARASGAAGSPMDALAGRLGHAEIGGQPVDSLPISAVRGQHSGHIGYGFAARCRPLIIDLGQSRLECRAREQRQ